MASHQEMGSQELRSRLLQFDQAVALRFPGQSFRLVLVGGGALLLLGYLQRTTLDLDVLAAPAELRAVMAEYDLSGQVAAYEDHFAYNLEDRLVPLGIGTVAVECCVASLEDLVASKLHSDRETDAADVRRPEVLAALDWDKLAGVAGEMRETSLNERTYRLFLWNFETYVKECRPCAG